MLSHVKTTVHSIRIANDVSARERKMIPSIKSHRSVLAACSVLALRVTSQTFNEKRPLTWQEFYPIYLACMIWSPLWAIGEFASTVTARLLLLFCLPRAPKLPE